MDVECRDGMDGYHSLDPEYGLDRNPSYLDA